MRRLGSTAKRLHWPASEPLPSPHCAVALDGKTTPFQLSLSLLSWDDWSVIVPPPGVPPANPNPFVSIMAPVGTAATLVEVEFWNPFWFRNWTAVIVE